MASTTSSTTTPSTATRKRVRFSRNLTVISPPAFPEKQTHNKWWSFMELSQFYHNAKLSSREAQKKNWMTRSFERSYQRSLRIALIHEDESRLYIRLQRLIPNQEIVDWCRYGHCKRGLERWSSKSHYAARSVAVTALRSSVVEMKGCDEQLIREVSESFSRASRVFARMMGQADAKAVANKTTVGMETLYNGEKQQQQQLLGGIVCQLPERVDLVPDENDDSRQVLVPCA